MNEEVAKKYHDKIVVIESFGSNEKIYGRSLIKEDDLIHYLYMLNLHEVSLTDDGLNFLKDYFSLNRVADIVLRAIKKGISFKYETKEKIIEWLESKGNLGSEH